MDEYRKVIAVDFDGTLFENKWPDIGNPIWPVIDAAKKEAAAGTELVLWTTREGDKLREALESCEKVGLTFCAVNKNAPVLMKLWGNDPRKIGAAEYWDDHAVNVDDIATTPKVYIKTRMRKIPVRCCDCSMFKPGAETATGIPACNARGGYWNGKILSNCRPYVERPKWCPLCTGNLHKK